MKHYTLICSTVNSDFAHGLRVAHRWNVDVIYKISFCPISYEIIAISGHPMFNRHPGKITDISGISLEFEVTLVICILVEMKPKSAIHGIQEHPRGLHVAFTCVR